MTRGRRSGHPATETVQAGAGPDKGRGHFSPRPAPPAPAVSRERFHGHGEICIACARPIYGLGERLTVLVLTTHECRRCSSRARWEFA